MHAVQTERRVTDLVKFANRSLEPFPGHDEHRARERAQHDEGPPRSCNPETSVRASPRHRRRSGPPQSEDGTALGGPSPIVPAAVRKAGLHGLWSHDLRRSFVTRARKAGVAESVVMRMSGHKTRL